MPNIIDNRSQLDQTVRIYDSFYATELTVGAAQYDIVYGYFSNVCATKNIAKNFTAVLFRVAEQSSIDVLELLDKIKGGGNKLEMNKVLSYYLNSFKSKTSLYGISIIPKPNQPVARNIVL